MPVRVRGRPNIAWCTTRGCAQPLGHDHPIAQPNCGIYAADEGRDPELACLELAPACRHAPLVTRRIAPAAAWARWARCRRPCALAGEVSGQKSAPQVAEQREVFLKQELVLAGLEEDGGLVEIAVDDSANFLDHHALPGLVHEVPKA